MPIPLITLAAIIIMFLIAAINWFIDIANFIAEARATLLDALDPTAVPLSDRFDNMLTGVFRLLGVQAMLYSWMVRVYSMGFAEHLTKKMGVNGV